MHADIWGSSCRASYEAFLDSVVDKTVEPIADSSSHCLVGTPSEGGMDNANRTLRSSGAEFHAGVIQFDRYAAVYSQEVKTEVIVVRPTVFPTRRPF